MAHNNKNNVNLTISTLDQVDPDTFEQLIPLTDGIDGIMFCVLDNVKKHPFCHAFIIEQDEEVLGWALTVPEVSMGQPYTECHFYVSKPHRGRGLGSLLSEAVTQHHAGKTLAGYAGCSSLFDRYGITSVYGKVVQKQPLTLA